MKYDIQFTNQFKKDLKLAKKQNKNLDKLFGVINILANGGTLEAKSRVLRSRLVAISPSVKMGIKKPRFLQA